MIDVRGLCKRFGRVEALRDVGFTVGRREVVGFVGENGAGKTTTLRIATGYLAADAGRVTIDGFDVARERLAAAARVGYLPELAPLYSDMRVDAYLRFRARLKRVARRDVADRVDEALAATGIEDRRAWVIAHLSRGYRQRVGIADALIARPPALILDEPTAGLDPVQVRELRGLIRALAADRAVLLSSHVLSEIEAVADRVVVLARGRVVADGTLDALRARHPDQRSLEDLFVALVSAGGGDGKEAE